MPNTSPDLLTLTAQIVSAHCARNAVAVEALPGLIRNVYSALNSADASEPMPEEKPVPAVSPRKSVFPDYIVCLEDGKKLKMLKRHLTASYGLTPDAYRERWGLPSDYPMVAPNYAQKRSDLVRKIGVGSRSEPQVDSQAEPALKRRGRRPAIWADRSWAHRHPAFRRLLPAHAWPGITISGGAPTPNA